MTRLITGVLVILLYTHCTPKPQPIHYGEDKCDFCRMTIVDARFAAEAITPKGRVSKFDAIECLLDMRQKAGEAYFDQLLVNTYLGKKLEDARTCTYLISENIPSPMGRYLSAYATRQDATEMQQTNGGTLYSWKELIARSAN